MFDISSIMELEGKDLIEIAESLSPEQKVVLLNYDRVLNAQSNFTPEGYKDFFYLVFQSELPKHAFYGWIVPLFYSRGAITREQFDWYYENGGEKFRFIRDKGLEYDVPVSGMVAEAFRESIKTTALTVGFTCFFIGHHPNTASLILQVGDYSAKKNARKIAEIIETSPAWRAVFPNVEPDQNASWGDNGFDVKRTDISYEKWKQTISKRRDNTFVGLGYNSRSNIGSHPDGILIIDDILDENNSSSEIELDSVLTILQGTIFYMMTESTWVVFVGTPWVNGDVLDFVKSTGEYLHTKIPAYWDSEELAENEDGELVPKRIYAWEESRGESWLGKKKRTTSSIEFARMVLLDLSKASSGSMKFYPFSSEAINWEWKMVGGADPTNVVPSNIKTGKRSYFALAYVAKLPQGGAVVVDGVLEQCSQIEAETRIAQAQTKFKNWQYCAIENHSGGALFIQVARRNSSLRIVDSDLSGFVKKGGRIRSKSDRIMLEMMPWFENGVVRISTAETPFLNALRRLFLKFYDLDPKSDYSFDVGDAVYHALKAMPDVLVIKQPEEGLASVKPPEKKVIWDMSNAKT